MQEERLLAGDVAVLEQAVEEIETALQRLAETLLLARDDVHDDVVVFDEIRVRRAHRLDGRVDHAPGDPRPRRRVGTHGAPRAG